MAHNTLKDIVKHINDKAKKISIITFNPSKEHLNKYNFITLNSKDITYELLKKAETVIDRSIAIKKLEKYVEWFIALEIEKGIFEFSLIKIVIDKLQINFVENIYLAKLQDICDNLDINNKRIDNQTLLPMINNIDFKPFFVAFLSPSQMHPQRWNGITEKMKMKEDTLNNMATTDIYECVKCHERKFIIYEMQMRSADEPTSKICTCTVCHNTFIIN